MKMNITHFKITLDDNEYIDIMTPNTLKIKDLRTIELENTTILFHRDIKLIHIINVYEKENI